MMKNKKNILIVATLVITALVIGGVFWFMRSTNQSAEKGPENDNSEVNVVDYGPPEESDKIQPSDKDKIIEGGSSDNSSSTTGLQITQATQQDAVVYIRTIIQGMSGGTCDLALSKGSQTIRKTVPIGVQASYAICQGFNIPVGEFPESGSWTVYISATSSSGATTEANAKVEVNK